LDPKEKAKVVEIIDSMSPRLIEISDWIGNNPELGNEEYKASQLLAGELKKHGFEVEMGICGLETAFKATFRGKPGGPTIAFMAEYDALPEIGHACGHNIIGTASVGAAIALSKMLPEMKGTVMVFGTPAEEGGAKGKAHAKSIMAEEGAFKGVDVAMMIHPEDSYTLQPMIAMEPLRITFRGKTSQASVAPHKGINALNALLLTFHGIDSLRQHLMYDPTKLARIHGIIKEGGERPNIVPDLAIGEFFIRSMDKKYREELSEKVRNIARGAALMTGAEVEFETFGHIHAPMKHNMVLWGAFKENYRLLGVKEIEEPNDYLLRKGCGSSDMGDVSQLVPSVHPFVQIVPKGETNHTREFAKAAVSEAGHRGLIIGAKALAMTAVDILTKPELLKAAREEFERTP